ncbi:GTP-binding protein [Paraburkholderia silvatlantica]|uniref:CobW/HypB/UreG family nucleotide-binding protein n=2 Tax=Paraburkholderia silvatlantica TaxID=321895 RepID=A0A2U1ABH3_9BURK|nr:GTP-binding protein [Paraburkholderia silvatlantica]PVY32126.1 CobW/HypB/UreG family nucleotide-binding protein [Paraburkholderia silvatlantica]PXW37746.1 CobW/HypB/UreG family nucleotide-binding protein [Paraburkholderia silvatlantica]PYE25567.1 CobW/HypB/UreG family nucleotide-binding protein [Paraburkholderia silvatlantica]TDQ97790.1 CobW/HypB/UreG family nucleotide-binding protein [Paraburkholderia silvatlantica]
MRKSGRGLKLRGASHQRTPSEGANSLGLPIAAVEQVEVIKGADAVLTGMMNPTGIVNVVTKQPTAEASRLPKSERRTRSIRPSATLMQCYNIPFSTTLPPEVFHALSRRTTACHGASQLDEHHEAQEQVGFADRILVSKADLVGEAQTYALMQRLRQMNPRAPIRTHILVRPMSPNFWISEASTLMQSSKSSHTFSKT